MVDYLFVGITISFIFVTHGFTNDTLSFPENFLFGTSTSAYQIEGGWNEGGKGESVWDRWTHEHPDLIRDGSNGDVACDSYHKYKEDVQLLKNMGVDFYRFSLSWTRILPTGYDNVVNQEGLDYYKNLIKELLDNGIEPFVTLYHWDHPAVFEIMGGWTNEMMVEWISDYARVVFKELGPNVKYFLTINEPVVICNNWYSEGKKLGYPAKYSCMHNILKAHAKIYHIYDTEFREQQQGQISIVLDCAGALPKSLSDAAAVDTFFQFHCGWVAHPIFSTTGDYPAVMKSRIAESSKLDGFSRSILPEFSPELVQYIKGTSDFFSLNHYSSKLVETVPRVPGHAWYDYFGVKASVDPSWPKGAPDWLRVVPIGFRELLKKISNEYDYPSIFIIENGFGDRGGIFDHLRITYLHSYMKEMLSAIQENGCKVKGYAVWSLLDSFEWDIGYTVGFGLVSVNFTDPNRTRTPKHSMNWFKHVIETKQLSIDEPLIQANHSNV
ncbi:PREDICTED: myrosinase 1-like [Vollenhovia emeryi]|uniref:myrosinase 1-like n=1 Tax=Vollenhovia emeryi TaxID=411798 RepID=UPI0005F57776|nr:PREDICTED: myrosinase 1-like [Vollenhovia emeryi]XP_011863826.1 PREDICTED: myrosinase 1-like [Vollenhovia emeryi]